MPGPFDSALSGFRFRAEGKSQGGALKRAFAAERGGAFTLYAQEECVVLLGSSTYLGGAAYSKEEALKGQMALDFTRFYYSYAKCDPADSTAFVFAGKTFQNMPAEEGDFTALDKLGHLEAGKISQGKSYVDLPLLAFLSLRKLGVKVENIDLLRYDISEYGKGYWLSGEKAANAFTIERSK